VCAVPERNKKVFIKLIAEVIRTAEACGVTVEKFEGVVDPTVFKTTDAEGIERSMQILDMMAAVAGAIYPGPLQDIEKGQKTEADYITGCCVDRAKEVGVATPINTKVRQILKQMETGEVKTSPSLTAWYLITHHRVAAARCPAFPLRPPRCTRRRLSGRLRIFAALSRNPQMRPA